MDINTGVVGRADLVEEVARIYGYDRFPDTQFDDVLPPQRDNVPLIQEEKVRDLLVEAGLQEVITYRLTTPAREALLQAGDAPPDDRPYVDPGQSHQPGADRHAPQPAGQRPGRDGRQCPPARPHLALRDRPGLPGQRGGGVSPTRCATWLSP